MLQAQYADCGPPEMITVLIQKTVKFSLYTCICCKNGYLLIHNKTEIKHFMVAIIVMIMVIY